MAITGGCACGRVRYELVSAPMWIQCCHCTECQRQTGGPFVINGYVELDRILVPNEQPVPISMPTESGRAHDVYRCPTCQVAVWSDYGHKPNIRFVRIATLDDPTPFTPNAHIFVRSKLPWFALPPGQPAFDIYYDMEREWPVASLERFRAGMQPIG